jgi:2-keto-4-pentenoate hydratase/2-oxohepta-3-ene-1,7-dioic acid hydratase in catechol pathway
LHRKTKTRITDKDEFMITLPILNKQDSYQLDTRIIIGVGLNYRDHIAEHQHVHVQGFTEAEPPEPILFPKTPNVLIGPGEPIVIPRFIDAYQFEDPRVDYEAELAFIIKKRCHHVPRGKAWEHILGYTCMNDVSQRNFQRDDKSGWFRGKSLDTFGPVGPAIVLVEDMPDPGNLDIRCRLNGREVQSSNTRNMIFPIDVLLAFISKQITLGPGDIVSTGTPSGVGPIAPGDIVEIEIEGIGILRNPVIAEP